jgi:hypothetical protein
MDTICSSVTSVDTYQITRRYMPVDVTAVRSLNPSKLQVFKIYGRMMPCTPESTRAVTIALVNYKTDHGNPSHTVASCLLEVEHIWIEQNFGYISLVLC